MKTYFDQEELNVLGCVVPRGGFDCVAHASRVLVSAFSRSRTCPVSTIPRTMVCVDKDRFGATPKPAREACTLPITCAKRWILDAASSKRKSKNE